MAPDFRIIHGDCVERMRELAAQGVRVQAIVCDPPYHLTSIVDRFGKAGSAPALSNGATGVYARASKGFMGQAWDGGDVAFRPETWRAAYDLLPPGGHLLAFGGTRTVHRLACAIEDAGFEIRNHIHWIYGTGFPKSHDVAKNIDKALGAEREVVGSKLGLPGYSIKANDTNAHGRTAYGRFTDAAAECAITAPATDEAKEWEGWGTDLKPAVEPIVLARKPLDGTIAGNVLAHGVGGLNIDACRIATDDGDDIHAKNPHTKGGFGHAGAAIYGSSQGAPAYDPRNGRWPANLVHSGDAEVEAAFAAFGERASGGPRGGQSGAGASKGSPFGAGWNVGATHGDTGSPSRFFYSSKAGRFDRVVQCLSCGARSYGKPACACVAPEKRSHPTTKPLSLMRWLVRMVTPPGGTVLDPFAGSGTTLAAASLEGFHSIGMELQAEHVGDVVFRMANLPETPPEPKPVPTKRAAAVARTRAIIRAKAPETVRQAPVEIGLFSFGGKPSDAV